MGNCHFKQIATRVNAEVRKYLSTNLNDFCLSAMRPYVQCDATGRKARFNRPHKVSHLGDLPYPAGRIFFPGYLEEDLLVNRRSKRA